MVGQEVEGFPWVRGELEQQKYHLEFACVMSSVDRADAPQPDVPNHLHQCASCKKARKISAQQKSSTRERDAFHALSPVKVRPRSNEDPVARGSTSRFDCLPFALIELSQRWHSGFQHGAAPC